MGNSINITINNLVEVKQQLLNFTEQFDICNYYDSNEISSPLHHDRFECLVGYGCIEKIEGNFETICQSIENEKRWVMGYWGYEAHTKFKTSNNLNAVENGFIIPELVVCINRNSKLMELINNGISKDRFEAYIEDLKICSIKHSDNNNTTFEFLPCTEKPRYLKNVERIKQQIVEGDFYEINYCQKFIHEGGLTQPLATFIALNQKSPTPFAAYIKNLTYTLLCTSPERFIYKQNKVLISQPIKGTNKRLKGNSNIEQMEHLRNDTKEIAENVMIVDLVRNDLAHVCKSGTIKVEELCQIYPFALVNQMISTVVGELNPDSDFKAIMEALFPMGSMTGAPKIEVMKNIAQYEDEPRGIYSGCIGYRMPNGDFDFNVIIRTMLEDKDRSQVSFHVGGAITYDSNPESEYEECMLKAKGLFKF